MFVKSNSWHCQFLYISNWWNIKVLSLSLLIGFWICILFVFYHSPSSQMIQSNKRISVKVQIHHLSKSMLWYRRSVYLRLLGRKRITIKLKANRNDILHHFFLFLPSFFRPIKISDRSDGGLKILRKTQWVQTWDYWLQNNDRPTFCYKENDIYLPFYLLLHL